MKKIDIKRIDLGGSNSYLVKCDDGYILVDTGIKGAGEKLVPELKKYNSKPENIRLIILTHNHYDHTMGLIEVKKLTGAPVAIHEAETGLSGEEQPAKVNEASFLFRMIVKVFGSITPKQETAKIIADIKICDEMDLSEYGVDAKLYHVPGHSPGSICLVTADNQCIIGDTLFNIFPGTHYPIIVYSRKILADTYNRLNNLNPEVYYPGHGKP
ncbi:MAG: MBL fold metallo-hydrolase, partial [Clostridiales bacterium]|nr:MBL fold metallo-hydrolase [Clostridiales bacterium]